MTRVTMRYGGKIIFLINSADSTKYLHGKKNVLCAPPICYSKIRADLDIKGKTIKLIIEENTDHHLCDTTVGKDIF